MPEQFILPLRLLQEKLEEPISTPSSPRDVPQDGDLAGNLSSSIQYLNQEVTRLRNQLAAAQTERKCQNMTLFCLRVAVLIYLLYRQVCS